MARIFGFWKINVDDPYSPTLFGFSYCKNYIDFWAFGVSVTFWLSFDTWMLYWNKDTGFCLGPIDIQWGEY